MGAPAGKVRLEMRTASQARRRVAGFPSPSGAVRTWYRGAIDGLAERIARDLAATASPGLPTGPTVPPLSDGSVIVLDYPVTPKPRFGKEYGLADHPELTAILARRDDAYREALEAMFGERDRLARIGLEAGADPEQPNWMNGWLPGLDGAALYTFVATRNPSLYVEVGSGNSTKFVRRAIRDHGLRTRIVSIDPAPRAEVDAICDEVVRLPLEETDLSLFSRLESGDVCFVDNSHRSFQNSDATVVFLEVLPRLAPGVLLGVHDIFLPADYPTEWVDRWYSEQYLLAAYLLGGGGGSQVVLASWYVSHHERFGPLLDELFADPLPAGIPRQGGAFWLTTG